MRFKKLRFLVGVSLIIFVFSVGNIIVFGKLINKSSVMQVDNKNKSPVLVDPKTLSYQNLSIKTDQTKTNQEDSLSNANNSSDNSLNNTNNIDSSQDQTINNTTQKVNTLTLNTSNPQSTKTTYPRRYIVVHTQRRTRAS